MKRRLLLLFYCLCTISIAFTGVSNAEALPQFRETLEDLRLKLKIPGMAAGIVVRSPAARAFLNSFVF